MNDLATFHPDSLPDDAITSGITLERYERLFKYVERTEAEIDRLNRELRDRNQEHIYRTNKTRAMRARLEGVAKRAENYQHAGNYGRMIAREIREAMAEAVGHPDG